MLGLSAATVLGYLLAKSHRLERLLSPYLVASQAIPIIAIAPLLIIWINSPGASKVLICALTIFFPTLINTIVGIRSVEPDPHALTQSLRASRWQILTRLEIPSRASYAIRRTEDRRDFGSDPRTLWPNLLAPTAGLGS